MEPLGKAYCWGFSACIKRRNGMVIGQGIQTEKQEVTQTLLKYILCLLSWNWHVRQFSWKFQWPAQPSSNAWNEIVFCLFSSLCLLLLVFPWEVNHRNPSDSITLSTQTFTNSYRYSGYLTCLGSIRPQSIHWFTVKYVYANENRGPQWNIVWVLPKHARYKSILVQNGVQSWNFASLVSQEGCLNIDRYSWVIATKIIVS